MRLLKQSTARNIMVLMIDSSDHLTGKTGLTLTITASKDGAAFASITPTVTDLGSGWYALALTTTHTNTLGALALHITATGADPSDPLCQVVKYLPGDNDDTILANQATIAGYIDTEVAAIKAKTDLIPASPAAVSDIPTANQIADATMTRASSNWEGTAPAKSLGAAIMKATHKVVDNSGAGTIDTYKSDGTTPAFSQTRGVSGSASPIVSQGGAA